MDGGVGQRGRPVFCRIDTGDRELVPAGVLVKTTQFAIESEQLMRYSGVDMDHIPKMCTAT
eukprot:2204471-Amphidinium_carterae.1